MFLLDVLIGNSFFLDEQSTNKGGSSTITLILSLLALLISIYNASRNLLDSMDSKSEYRKKLFEASAKNKINDDDYLFLRSTMRYKAKTKSLSPIFIKDFKEFNQQKIKSLQPFDYMTAFIIKFCESNDQFIKMKDHENNDVFICKNAENFRILCRYVLKHHWESNNHSIFQYKAKDKFILMNDTIILLNKYTCQNNEVTK
ncbi:hypothetical protein QI113_12275 [Staphylococcus saprophyticus]|uniref:hypothetical protein n=1 Tax=Staphylococcus saprophyticus TaxID=29385 RepID=UPI002977DDB7|nr:hypothetical protein [Staphylococcus saprophyticus]